ncbi:MAG: acyl carrier protein [Desulfobulbaceae bacterium]|nr:acyl carrier protein [Desulfobulbaceae bacterium]
METLMSETILNSVIAAIAKQKHIEPESITHTSLLDGLGVSSLDAITIVFDIEEEFDIEVPGDVLEGLKSVQDIVDGISELINSG